VFPDSCVLDIARFPAGGPVPAGIIIPVRFVLAGQELIPLIGGPMFRLTEAVSRSVRCETQDGVDRYWARLGEGGEPRGLRLAEGRSGLSWPIVPTVPPEMLQYGDAARAGRVMAAMRQMGRLDIAKLQQAFG
jgi:predicted 3-demethylubiquinone-9 3-methyltransferase (glyoxalase superfamily)